jgi:hypothetical protein
MTRNQIHRQLQEAFRRYLGVSTRATQGLVPQSVSAGKLYEAHVLSRVVEHLVDDEGYVLTLAGGTKLQLKSSPGPINRAYPRIELRRSGICVAELWTDVEFMALSYCRRQALTVTKGDYHELDILIVPSGAAGRPQCDAIWLGVECKNTGYEKVLLKEILGIRRELSFVTPPDRQERTQFRYWPRTTVPATPASCLLVYSTDASVAEYAAPGNMFGIDFIHEPM